MAKNYKVFAGKFNSVVKNKTSITMLCSNSMFTVLLDSGKQ